MSERTDALKAQIIGADLISARIQLLDTLEAVIRKESQAAALRDAAAATFEHTTIGHKNERTKSQRPVLSKDVRAWLEARADVLEAGDSSGTPHHHCSTRQLALPTE